MPDNTEHSRAAEILLKLDEVAESERTELLNQLVAGDDGLRDAVERLLARRDQAGPFDVFLSYNSEDLAFVRSVAEWLDDQGVKVWFDAWKLIAGQDPQDEIEKALSVCRNCVVFNGPNGRGPWQKYEIRTAISQAANDAAFRVIPALLPDSNRAGRSKLPGFLATAVWVEFQSSDDSRALRRLECGIRGIEPGRDSTTPSEPNDGELDRRPEPAQRSSGTETGNSKPTEPDETNPRSAASECPYLGLESFGVRDAARFFGREADVGWLLDDIRPDRAGTLRTNFLAIVGASGSGKSSVARAGLIAALQNREDEPFPGCSDWLFAECRPGREPLRALALALAGLPGSRVTDSELPGFIESLQTNPGQLDLSVDRVLKNDTESRQKSGQPCCLLLVDQFEEVFAQCPSAEDRQAFFDNLLYPLARAGESRVLVVVTMRSDFYGRCADHAALASAVADHQVLLGSLNESGLRDAIQSPAALAEAVVEPELTAELLKQTHEFPGRLPLLQDAMVELWNRRTADTLTRASLEDINGVAGALEQRAELLYAELTEAQQTLAQQLFLRLIEPQPGESPSQATRRRVPESELNLASATDAEQTQELVRLLARRENRLVVTGRDGDDGQAWVEIIHEALIQGWKRLQDWIGADREGQRIHRQLTLATAEWLQRQRDEGILFRGLRLSETEAWTSGTTTALSRDEAAFLAASQASRDEAARQELEHARELTRVEQSRAEEAERRVQEQKQATRRFRRAAVVAGIFGTIAIGLAVAASVFYEQADADRIAAVEAGLTAQTKAEEADAQRRRAEASSATAREQTQLALDTLSTVIFDIQRGLKNVPGAGEVRKKLLSTALHGLTRIAKDFADEGLAVHQTSAVLNDLADTILRLGQVDPDLDVDGIESTSAVEFALSLYHRSLEINRRLAESEPNNVQAQRDLSISCVRLGDANLKIEKFQEAGNYYQMDFDIAMRLFESNPNDLRAQRDLSISYAKIGNHSLQAGDVKHAEVAYREALIIQQGIVKSDPKTKAERDLANTYDHLGAVSLEDGKVADALKWYLKGLCIRERLEKRNPKDAQARRDLSISYTKLGDVSLQSGAIQKAFEYFRKDLEIAEDLSGLDQNDVTAQGDLAVSYGKVGAVSLRTGDVHKAVRWYRKALHIRGRLAKLDRVDAQAQRKLSASYHELGDAEHKLSAYADAATSYWAGINVLDGMIAAGQKAQQSTEERGVLLELARSADQAAAEQAAAATVEWVELLKQPDEQLPTLLAVRCTELARQQKFEDVAQAAGTLRTMSIDAAKGTANEQQGGLLYNAACGYGLCAGGVQPAEGQELTADQQTRRREFQDLALTCLTEAIAAGYDNFKLMRQDTDLSALHDLPEFKALLPPEPPTQPED